MTGIYKITNKNNGKIYIGQSKDIMRRWADHEKLLLKHAHHSTKLQNDFDSNGGIGAFEFSVVELCSLSDLDEREKFYINKFDTVNSGYNSFQDNCDNKERSNVTISNAAYNELQKRTGNSYLMTYLYLKFNSDDDNQITLNQTQLADKFGVGVLTISKHIRFLVDNGVIRNVGKIGVYNKYEILI